MRTSLRRSRRDRSHQRPWLHPSMSLDCQVAKHPGKAALQLQHSPQLPADIQLKARFCSAFMTVSPLPLSVGNYSQHPPNSGSVDLVGLFIGTPMGQASPARGCSVDDCECGWQASGDNIYIFIYTSADCVCSCRHSP